MRERLLQFAALRGVSGWEDPVLEEVRREVERLGAPAETDKLGNLIVKKQGARRSRQTILLSAHVDEPGVLVKAVTDEGLLQFGLVGDLDPRTVLGKRVSLGRSALPGVVGLKAIHLTTAEERKTSPGTSELYLDVGAKSREEAERLAPPGTWGTFAEPNVLLGRHGILAKALGRSIGCVCLLTLLGQELPMDVTVAFTRQRCVGSRGAFAAAAAVRPELVLTLDAVPAGDVSEDAQDRLPKPGGGPAVCRMDGKTLCDRFLADALERAAQAVGVAVQTLAWNQGGGDAAVYQKSGGGARVLSLGVPVRNLHGVSGTADLWDVYGVCTILPEFLKQLEDTVCG